MGVRPGLEVILEEEIRRLQGKRVGVIAHPASVNSRLEHVVDLFFEHPEVRLSAVFGPQHGARGETQDNMIEWEGYRDPVTGLPVQSLYGGTRQPTPEMLEEIEVLVFDLQDVGARYYTFISTMALAMEACAREDKTFLVLDRPNPINGVDVEGPVLDPAFRSFVGLYPLPIRHGMTAGELARYFNQEFSIGCPLEVVPMQGWRRDMFFEDTGLPWVLPSPNVPTVDSAVVYPGSCILEGTNVSEGRGTTRPFELTGAPWIAPRALGSSLMSLDLPGAVFRPVHYAPTFHKWARQTIGGVQIHVVDRRRFLPFRTGLALVKSCRQLGPGEFEWLPPPYEYEYEKLPFDILCGTDRVRQLLEAGVGLEEIEACWRDVLAAFQETRRRYLLY